MNRIRAAALAALLLALGATAAFATDPNCPIDPTQPTVTPPGQAAPSSVIRNNFAAALECYYNVIGEFAQPSAPSSPHLLQFWWNTSAIPWVKNQWDGGAWVAEETLDPTTHVHAWLIPVTSVFGRTGDIVAETGDYTVAQITGAAPLASPVFTGFPQAPTPTDADDSTDIATTAWVWNQDYATVAWVYSQAYATLLSPALTGTPTAPTQASGDNSTDIATDAFVQGLLVSPAFTGTPTAPTPANGDDSTRIATTDWVQHYLGGGVVSTVFGRAGTVTAQTGDYSVSQVTGAAPLASPPLTGAPTAPTQSTSDSSTDLATDAFVKNVVASFAPLASPALTGAPTAPTQTAGDSSTKIATDAFVAVSFAPLASPAMTGAPTAPTATAGDNSTKVATTAYVQGAVGGGGTPQGRLTLQSGSPIGETVTALAVTLNAAGITASYAPADTITLAGGTVTTPTVLTVTNTVLGSVTPLATGSGYVPADTVTLGFTGATFTGSVVATVTDTQVTSFAYHSAGTGTCTAGTYPFTTSNGTGTKATGSAAINASGVITSISLLTGGSYSVNPSPLTAATPNYTGTPCNTTAPTINITMGPSVLTLTTNTAVFGANGSAATQASTSGSGTGATFGSVLYAPNALTISAAGAYSAAPGNPVAQGSTSGSGAGATFTMSWGASIVYYQSFGGGNNVPVYNGSSFVAEPIGTGLSLVLDSNSGDTGYQASGNIYDIFAAVNGGTLVDGTGPAWTSSTARGTGSGTTQIVLQNGIWVNANTITLRYGNSSGNTISVPAGEATYLGSLYATANGETKSDLGCNLAVGGYGSVAGLYNAYNRIRTPYCSSDTTASWSYSSGSWRAADASTSNRITFVDGLGESPVTGKASGYVELLGEIGIDLDGTSARPQLVATSFPPSGYSTEIAADYIGAPELGLHYLQEMEVSGGTATFNGGSTGLDWLRGDLDN